MYFVKPKVKAAYMLAPIKKIHLDRVPASDQDEIGFELELEGEHLSRAYDMLTATGCDYWERKRDASLNATGFEFTFTKPLNRSLARQALTHFFEVFNSNATIIPSDRCSSHMHMNFQHRSVLQVYTFQTIFSILEQALFIRFAPERINNRYCMPYFSCNNFDAETDQSLKKGVLKPTYKYRSLNTAPIAEYGSVECRLLGGSTDAAKPITFMETMLEAYDYVRDNPRVTPRDILDGDSIVDWVKTNLPRMWDEIKNLDGIEKMLELGTKTAGSFAYAVDWTPAKTGQAPINPRKINLYQELM